jgi:hypothetical protein
VDRKTYFTKEEVQEKSPNCAFEGIKRQLGWNRNTREPENWTENEIIQEMSRRILNLEDEVRKVNLAIQDLRARDYEGPPIYGGPLRGGR